MFIEKYSETDFFADLKSELETAKSQPLKDKQLKYNQILNHLLQGAELLDQEGFSELSHDLTQLAEELTEKMRKSVLAPEEDKTDQLSVDAPLYMTNTPMSHDLSTGLTPAKSLDTIEVGKEPLIINDIEPK